MRTIKFRAYQDDKMYYAKSSGIYATKRFLNTLYEDCELMQFTGLQDKTSKDIYEGDICKNTGATWEVIFNKGCFCARIINKPYKKTDTHIALRAIKEIEVIGNIHETTEL